MFTTSADEYRSDSLFELRHLAAGVDSVESALTRLRSDTDRNGQRLADALEGVVESQGGLRHLVADGLRVQRAILDALVIPSATAAAELAERGRSFARRQLWPEAITAFERSLGENPDQPDTLFHQGIAIAALTAEEPAGPRRDRLRASAESFKASARYGADTMPTVAAAAVLMAATQFDRVGDKAAADEVLRWACRQLPKSPEVLFGAALRFADGDLLDRAVRLDPVLAADVSWQSRPFARQAVAGLLDRQRAAITGGNEWLRAAEAATATAQRPESPPRTCLEGLQIARNLLSRLDGLRAQLTQLTPAERQHLDAAHHSVAQTQAATAAAIRVTRRPGEWLRSGLLGGSFLAVSYLAICIGFAAIVGPDSIEPTPTWLSLTAMIGFPAATLIGILIIISPLFHAGGRTRQAEAITAGNPELLRRAEDCRSAAGAMERQRDAVRDRLPPVTAALTAVTTRSPEAYRAV